MRVAATARNWSRTTNLPSITSFTMMAWVKIVTDRNDYGAFLKLGANSATHYTIGVTSDGTTLNSYNGSAEVTGAALTVGTWYHVAMTVAGTGAGQFLGYQNGVLNITNAGNAGVTAALMMVDDWATAGAEWIDGTFAAVKIYDAVLTAAEIAQEMRQYLPVRTLNLNSWFPFLSSADDEIDYSGNGRSLTVTGVPTTDDGPPIPWKSGRQRVVLAPAAVVAFLARKNLPILQAVNRGANF